MERRTFVLDTSVLLSDPAAWTRFDEHEVVLPVVVDHRARGQTLPPRARLLRAQRAADARRPAGRRTAGSTKPLPIGDDGGVVRVELNHTDPAVLPPGFRLERQRHPHPRGGAQPRRRGPSRHAGLQGPADAGQGLGRRSRRRGVPRRVGGRVGLDRHGRDRGRLPTPSTGSTTTSGSTSTQRATCRATPAWCCSPTEVPDSVG